MTVHYVAVTRTGSGAESWTARFVDSVESEGTGETPAESGRTGETPAEAMLRLFAASPQRRIFLETCEAVDEPGPCDPDRQVFWFVGGGFHCQI